MHVRGARRRRRTAVTTDIDTLIRRSARLETADLDLVCFATRPLDPATLRCLRYMHDVEGHTACYLRDVLATRAHRDPQMTAFLACWCYEEHWHGDAIASVLARPWRGRRVGPPRPGTPRLAQARRPAPGGVHGGLRPEPARGRRAHGVGCAQRVDHPGRLRTIGGQGQAPRAQRAARAHHAPGGAPHRLLRPAGPAAPGPEPHGPAPHPRRRCAATGRRWAPASCLAPSSTSSWHISSPTTRGAAPRSGSTASSGGSRASRTCTWSNKPRASTSGPAWRRTPQHVERPWTTGPAGGSTPYQPNDRPPYTEQKKGHRHAC